MDAQIALLCVLLVIAIFGLSIGVDYWATRKVKQDPRSKSNPLF